MYRSLASKVAVTAGLALLWSAPASAQTPQEWREADEGSQHEGGLILEQVYHGVLPGTGNTLPRVEELRTKTGTWVTWPGFFMLPSGGSRIFIQTTSRLDYNRKDKKRTLVLHFDDASVFLDNNRNPLVTIHFNTPVRSAFLKKRRKGRRK